MKKLAGPFIKEKAQEGNIFILLSIISATHIEPVSPHGVVVVGPVEDVVVVDGSVVGAVAVLRVAVGRLRRHQPAVQGLEELLDSRHHLLKIMMIMMKPFSPGDMNGPNITFISILPRFPSTF